MTNKRDEERIFKALTGLMVTILALVLWSGLFCLTWNHVAPTYFYWLPSVYHDIGFLDTFCILFAIRTLARSVLLKVGDE